MPVEKQGSTHLPANLGVGLVVFSQRALQHFILLLRARLAAAAAAALPGVVQQGSHHDVREGSVQLGIEAGVVHSHRAALQAGQAGGIINRIS